MTRTTRWITFLALSGLGVAAPSWSAPSLITSVDLTARPIDLSLATGDPKAIDAVAVRTAVTKPGVCRGEVFTVNVTTNPPAGAGWVSVMIDGYPGAQRQMQYRGEPGRRQLSVSAATESGTVESQTIEVPVLDCELSGMPSVRSRFNPYHPYTVDFVIENAEAIKPWFGTQFTWDFGDGTTETTQYPYASHSYLKRIDGTVPYQGFTVTVSSNNGPLGPRISRAYSLTVANNYYHARKRGIVQPLTVSSRLEARGPRLVGTYTLKNLEAVPIIFQSATIEDRFCDPNRTGTASPVLPSQVIYQGARSSSNPVITGRNSPDLVEAERIRLSLPGLPADAVVIPPRLKAEDPSPLDPEALDAYFPPGEPPVQVPGSTPVQTTLPPAGASGVVVVPAGHLHQGFLTLDATRISESVCGVGYHLRGVTADNRPVYASFYFGVKNNPALRQRVTDPVMKTFLIQLFNRGLVPAGTKVTQEDLYRLEQKGLIRRTVNGWEVL